jgi:hypothetical protein
LSSSAARIWKGQGSIDLLLMNRPQTMERKQRMLNQNKEADCNRLHAMSSMMLKNGIRRPFAEQKPDGRVEPPDAVNRDYTRKIRNNRIEGKAYHDANSHRKLGCHDDFTQRNKICTTERRETKP